MLKFDRCLYTLTYNMRYFRVLIGYTKFKVIRIGTMSCLRVRPVGHRSAQQHYLLFHQEYHSTLKE